MIALKRAPAALDFASRAPRRSLAFALIDCISGASGCCAHVSIYSGRPRRRISSLERPSGARGAIAIDAPSPNGARGRSTLDFASRAPRRLLAPRRTARSSFRVRRTEIAPTPRSTERSAQIRAIGAVHGMRSQAQPELASAQLIAGGESIDTAQSPETRASHSRPVRRAVRDL